MKKDKPARPDPMQPFVLAPVGHKPPKYRPFVSTAHSIAKGRKRHGWLNRDTLNKLGKALVSGFDGIRNEGVPDRFKALLQQIEDRKHQDGNNDKRSN